MSETRICKVCGIEKELETSFRKIKYNKGKGYYYLRACKDCQRPIQNEIARRTWHKHNENNLKKQRIRSVNWRKIRRQKGLCVHCGIESNTYLCRKCSIKYQEKMLRYRDKKRREIIEIMGGKCAHCGVSENINIIFEFHHLENKDVGIAKLLSTNVFLML